MTTIQLVRKLRKYFRENGETSLPEINIPEIENGGGVVHKINVLCMDSGQIGVASANYFFPLEELTWKELYKIKKHLFNK